ncbi:MAG: hypothetical protein QM754_08080 [Tepidisphaeraceae bacterium]
MSLITNDGTQNPPRLAIYLNLGNLVDLPDWSTWPKLQGADAIAYLKSHGFEGIQDGDAALAKAAGIGSAGGGRIDSPAESDPFAKKMKDAGHDAATVHVGYGFEDDAETDALVDSVLNASAKTGVPIFIETHRATITQDAWRTIQLTKRRPDVRFNGDFSHFYTGQELVYGDLDAKFDKMQPIFDRVRFMHGRIGSPGCIQVDIGDGTSPALQQTGTADFVAHFRDMWTRAMAGFLKHASAGDYLVFAPEILTPFYYYGRKFVGPDGQLREESDRWQQALVYKRIAEECFAAAKLRLA